jgi:hypothetical protein
MKKLSSYPRIAPHQIKIVLFIALLSLVFAFASYPVIRAYADAGPFPTRTPTITLTPTVSPTPSPTQLSATLTPTITLVPTPTDLELGEVVPPLVVVPTPTPAPQGRSLLACWPIALIVLVAIIIASTYFLTRYSSQAQPIE